MELLFFAVWCRPFHNYWSVPAANPQCSTYHDHLVVNTVFNISSDLMMLCIPLPILVRAKLPLQKKLILCIVFSMGIFVIICAVLSKYYSFSLPYGFDWVRSIPSAHPSLILPKHIWANSPPIKGLLVRPRSLNRRHRRQHAPPLGPGAPHLQPQGLPQRRLRPAVPSRHEQRPARNGGARRRIRCGHGRPQEMVWLEEQRHHQPG